MIGLYKTCDLLDYRLEPGNTSWADAVATGTLPKADVRERKYEETGFATPSGKVELYSSILDDFGFDPLPYYREAQAPSAEFPLSMFIGLPDDEYYRTGHRHIPELRKRASDPAFFVSKEDLATYAFTEGDWAEVATSTGKVAGRVYVRRGMPQGLVRVPHGWWKPEVKEGFSGMWTIADAQVTPDDDPDLIDLEQGIPHMKGMPCSLRKLTDEEVAKINGALVFGESRAADGYLAPKVLQKRRRVQRQVWLPAPTRQRPARHAR